MSVDPRVRCGRCNADLTEAVQTAIDESDASPHGRGPGALLTVTTRGGVVVHRCPAEPAAAKPSTAARRIAREHNRNLAPEAIARPGGVMYFTADGRLLGAAVQDGFDRGPEVIVFPVRSEPVSVAAVQAWLDARGPRDRPPAPLSEAEMERFDEILLGIRDGSTYWGPPDDIVRYIATIRALRAENAELEALAERTAGDWNLLTEWVLVHYIDLCGEDEGWPEFMIRLIRSGGHRRGPGVLAG